MLHGRTLDVTRAVTRDEAAKLKAQYKQERKGAIRELRKDARFLASEQQKKQKEKEGPKAWESWDKHREHRDWQYSAEAEYRDEAARMNEGVQEAVQKVAGFVQGALGSGWWETVKKTVEGSGLVGTDDAKDRESRSKRGAKEEAKGRAGTR